MGLINSMLFSDRAPKLLQKALDLNARQVAVSASNISNAETPGYKATKFEFERALQDAVDSGGSPLRATQLRHFPTSSPEIGRIEGITDVDLSQGRLDGNNVDLEKEMVTFSEAQISYEAAITALTKRAGIIRSAITDVK